MRGVNEPARGGTDDRGRLPGDAAHRNRTWQHRGRNDVGRDRAHRGSGEDARDAVERGEAEEQIECQPIGPGEPAERRGDEKIDEVREDGNAAPFEPVGRPTRDGCEDRERNELEQTEQAELERCIPDRHAIVGARGVIELVADHNDHRDRRHHCGEARDPEIPEVGITERRGGFERCPRHHRFFAFGGRDRRHRSLP